MVTTQKEVSQMKQEKTLWSVVYKLCAPLIYHEVSGASAKDQRIDSITLVDQLGGWDKVAENPRLALRQDMPAWIYYEVIRGKRYWYVIFQVYHPIDKKTYIPFSVGSHPQDLEWATMVYDSKTDRVIAGATLFHHLWYFCYRPGTGIQPQQSFFNIRELHVDGPTHRPTIHIQAGGHGIRPFNPGRSGGRRIIYTPNTNVNDVPWTVAWFPSTYPPFKTVRYRLQRLTARDGLWAHRRDPRVFRRNHGKQDRLVCQKNGQIVPSPATPVWASGDQSSLIKVESAEGDRWLTPLVVEPNRVFREVLKGIAWDPIIENPFVS